MGTDQGVSEFSGARFECEMPFALSMLYLPSGTAGPPWENCVVMLKNQVSEATAKARSSAFQHRLIVFQILIISYVLYFHLEKCVLLNYRCSLHDNNS